MSQTRRALLLACLVGSSPFALGQGLLDQENTTSSDIAMASVGASEDLGAIRGQTFTVGLDGVLHHIELNLANRFSSPDGDPILVKLVAGQAAWTESAVATSTIQFSNVPVGLTPAFVTADFESAQLQVHAGEVYTVWISSTAPALNHATWWGNTSNSYSRGRGLIFGDDSGQFANPALDFAFRTYVAVDQDTVVDQENTTTSDMGLASVGEGEDIGAIRGQTFTVGLDGILDRIEFNLANRFDSPDDDPILVKVVAGVSPWSEAAVATSIIQFADIPVGSAPAFVAADFSSSQLQLRAGDVYTVWISSLAPSLNHATWWGNTNNSYSRGRGLIFGNDIGQFSNPNLDFAFRTYVTSGQQNENFLTFHFQGTLISAGGLPASDLGTTVRGSYTFDPTRDPTGPIIGNTLYPDVLQSFAFATNGSATGTANAGRISVQNQAAPFQDNYTVRTLSNAVGPSISGLPLTEFALVLVDNLSRLTTTALPLTPPDLSQFNLATVLQVDYGVGASRKFATYGLTHLSNSPLTADADFDGVSDEDDNCPTTRNIDQADTNNDGVGDACAGTADTPVGNSIAVEPVVDMPDGVSTSTVQLTFESVESAGVTTVSASDTPAGDATASPPGFKVGSPAVYYDVDTTAVFSGPVALCFSWQEGQIANENNVKLFHFENDTWRNVTTSLNTDANTVCGEVTSLSPFALFETSFAGLFAPVDNPPIRNSVKAGAAVPVKFSLDGDHGLSIFKLGYPLSHSMTCDSGSASDSIEETVTAGGSNLSYDASSDLYTYVWKTNKAWGNTCRRLVLKLSSDLQHAAEFEFYK